MTELNYQELVAGYYDNLNNNLRNFKGGPGFLETWVHDEDHNRSLLEILDLAHSHGISDLNIHLQAAVATEVNLDWLRRNASEFGSLELKGESLTFTNAKGVFSLDEFAGLSENYIEKVKSLAKKVEHEGVMADASFSASFDSAKLSVLLDEKGLVKNAKHSGSTGPERTIMDSFCTVLIGRPLQEGAEHGAIRLETLLRDHSKAIKVKGLLTPETADPIFALPGKLVRQIWTSYVNTQGETPGRNFWRDPVPASWLALSPEEKLKQGQIKLTAAAREFGLQVDVLVTEIKNDTRLVLSFKQNPDKPDFGRHMIKLERWLRAQMGFEVELQLESIEDRNRREERTKRT
jgi:hypothetical protein